MNPQLAATSSIRRRRVLAGVISATFLATLLVPTLATTAHAADGRGDGRAVSIGVAADNFVVSSTSKVDIVPSQKYPGTVRFERDGGKKCLATKGGKNDNSYHGVQWTGCNDHSSKNWVLEPYHTSGNKDPLATATDDTLAELNTVATGEAPRFVVRSYRYPKHCLFSRGNGLDGAGTSEKRGITPHCTAADTAEGANRGTLPATTMHFAVHNDTAAQHEWEFLRKQMYVGAAAIYSRGLEGQFSGDNLWVKPMSVDGEYVGLSTKASSDGFFTPSAVEIDPAKEGAVVARTSSSDGCLDQKWWWGIDNTRGQAPVTQEVSTGAQHTDDLGIGFGVELGVEKEGKIGPLSGKFSVKVSGNINRGWSDTQTTEQKLSMTIPEGLWGMAVVTTPSVTTLGNWKSGVAFDRTWKFNGVSTIALKNSQGEPADTIAAFVQSHERKSCKARESTDLIAGQSPRVILPGKGLAPVVGDTLTAHAPFLDPNTDTPLDIKYQWLSNGIPLSGQTLKSLLVTPEMIGEQLSFETYESGSTMRFESKLYRSTQSAPVQAATAPQLPAENQTDVVLLSSADAYVLPEAIVGRAVDMRITGVPGLGTGLTLVDGALPSGLKLDTDTDTISGVPGARGVYEFTLEDQLGSQVVLRITVDPALTMFSAASGVATQVGNNINVPLITEGHAFTQYAVQFQHSDGRSISTPAGLVLNFGENGVPRLSGTSATPIDFTAQVTEAQVSPAPEDGRITSHEIRFQFTAAQLAQPEVLNAPEVSISHMRDDQEAAPGVGSGITVGEHIAWQVHATDAEDINVSVNRVSAAQPVSWIEKVQTLANEVEIDALPTEPGNYLISVTARNSAGTTTETFEFSVSAAVDGSDDAVETPIAAGPGDKENLSQTGSSSETMVYGGIALAAVLALLGGWLIYRARSRSKDSAE